MNQMKPRILVTGAGSGMGFDAIRALITYSGIKEIFACNVTAECPARALVKQFVISPDFYFTKTHNESDFVKFILNFTERNQIDVIIPLSIFELHPLAQNIDAFTAMGTRVLVESVETIQTLGDKLTCANFIQSQGGYSPASEEIIEDGTNDYLPSIPYPMIIKPRFGYGSNGIKILHTQEDFIAWRSMKKDERFKLYMAQAYLPSSEKEYTCSILYRQDRQPLKVIAMRRLKLKGITLAAVYDNSCSTVEDYLFALAPKLCGQYSLNAQLRVEDGDPYIFEINPRFSSSEPLRRLVGHDSYLQILSQYYAVNGHTPSKRYGTTLRAYTEVFLPNK